MQQLEKGLGYCLGLKLECGTQCLKLLMGEVLCYRTVDLRHMIVLCPLFDCMGTVIDCDPLDVLSFSDMAGSWQCVEIVCGGFRTGDGELGSNISWCGGNKFVWFGYVCR